MGSTYCHNIRIHIIVIGIVIVICIDTNEGKSSC